MSTHAEQVRTEIRALLKERGLRSTAPRMAVLVTLHEQAGPMSHEQIMEALPTGMFDKASVWRLLADLAEAGVLRRMDLGDRTWRYELLDACRTVTDDHPHFLCEDCGDVSCLPALEVRSRDGELPEALQGAEFRLRIMGRCADCTAAA